MITIDADRNGDSQNVAYVEVLEGIYDPEGNISVHLGVFK